MKVQSIVLFLLSLLTLVQSECVTGTERVVVSGRKDSQCLDVESGDLDCYTALEQEAVSYLQGVDNIPGRQLFFKNCGQCIKKAGRYFCVYIGACGRRLHGYDYYSSWKNKWSQKYGPESSSEDRSWQREKKRWWEDSSDEEEEPEEEEPKQDEPAKGDGSGLGDEEVSDSDVEIITGSKKEKENFILDPCWELQGPIVDTAFADSIKDSLAATFDEVNTLQFEVQKCVC